MFHRCRCMSVNTKLNHFKHQMLSELNISMQELNWNLNRVSEEELWVLLWNKEQCYRPPFKLQLLLRNSQLSLSLYLFACWIDGFQSWIMNSARRMIYHLDRLWSWKSYPLKMSIQVRFQKLELEWVRLLSGPRV